MSGSEISSTNHIKRMLRQRVTLKCEMGTGNGSEPILTASFAGPMLVKRPVDA
jgi:hypothetical protein